MPEDVEQKRKKTRVLDVAMDPTGAKREAKAQDAGIEDEAKDFEEYCPFPNDKYIDEKHWNNPIITLLLTKICQPSRVICLDERFGAFILFVIIIAGVLVGVQTYDGMEFNSTVNAIDMCVLVVFCVECVLKIFAEGLASWRFYTGECVKTKKTKVYSGV